jgi:hypothetical protein
MTAQQRDTAGRWMPSLVTLVIQLIALGIFVGRTEAHFSNSEIHMPLAQRLEIFQPRKEADAANMHHEASAADIKASILRLEAKVDRLLAEKGIAQAP